MEKEKSQKPLIIFLVIIILLLLGMLVYLLFFNKKEDVKPINSNEQGQIENKKLYHIEDGEKFTVYGKENGSYISRNFEISFAYPVIDIDDNEVKVINNEIANNYKNDYNINLKNSTDGSGCVAIRKNNKYYSGEHVVYDTSKVFEKDNYLSIVIKSVAYTECASGGPSYRGYVINKTTKKVMSNAELVKMFNANEQKIIDKYNENANALAYNKAKTIDDVNLFVYENDLAIVSIGGDYDDLLLYANGNFKNVD